MLAEHPDHHRANAPTAEKLHATRDPRIFVPDGQDVTRVWKHAVDLAPYPEVWRIRERVEEVKGRQPIVAPVDLLQQRLSVIGARIAARPVAVDRPVPENVQCIVQARRARLVEADAEDLPVV